MAEATLFDRVLELPRFAELLERLVTISVSGQFPALSDCAADEIQPRDLAFALECASVLARSGGGETEDAALRVAHHALCAPKASDLHRVAAAVVLDTMKNRRAIRLAVEKGLLAPNYAALIPGALRLDMARRETMFSIFVNGKIQTVNAFQREVYDLVDESNHVSVSAPTSSGKSFILRSLVEKWIETGGRCCIFVVPTRALIQEVETDLQEITAASKEEILVSSIPRLPEEWSKRSMVLVLTQERLQWLLNDAPPEFGPELLIVDEAQKIGDGARGILLEQVLEDVMRRVPSTKIVFASPMTTNPEILFDFSPSGSTGQTITSEHIAVNQNLLWASQKKGKPQRWTIELCRGGRLSEIGSLDLPHRPDVPRKRLAFVAHALAGSESGNLVYVNEPAEAEKTAHLLWSLHEHADFSPDEEIDALIDLVRRTVHKDYALASVLGRRVAFHYGNMPLLLRTEIERLFKDGKIRFLVCTSTLLEGVNLPARSIFVRGPQRGKGKPMTEMDFWNLAGRAGRLGKEFQGNVVCVDPRIKTVWPESPPTKRKRYPIKIALDEVTSRGDELVKAIDDASAGSPMRDPAVEYAFARLFAEHIRAGGLLASEHVSRLPEHTGVALHERFLTIHQELGLPDEVIRRNPGVSPLSLRELLTKFNERVYSIDDFVPVLPESDDALDTYLRVVGLISQCFTREPQALVYPRALLVVNWMRGWPLARIIDKNLDYWNKKSKTPKALAAVIRETMRDVEEYARFKFAKYAACYVDVLRVVLGSAKRTDLLDALPNLPLWLEFGAASATRLSLMGLGLSRSTALAVADIIADDNLDETGVRTRLREMNIRGLSLSPIMLAELERVVRKAQEREDD